MQTILKTFGSSALLSFVLILPFMIMEVVNRRNFQEGFPIVLFFVMWLNLFAISLIILPILRARWKGNQGVTNPALAQGNALFTNPRRAAVISVILFLSPGVLPLLDAVGWLSLDRLFNGPNSELAYVPGQLLLLGLILFPIAAGIVAGQPIVGTLRAGGSLFAYPFHLFIVVGISFLFAVGVAGLIVDQWPCFVGVPNCD